MDIECSFQPGDIVSLNDRGYKYWKNEGEEQLKKNEEAKVISYERDGEYFWIEVEYRDEVNNYPDYDLKKVK